MRLEFAKALETIQRSGDFDAGFGEVLAHLPGWVRDGLDAIQVDFVGGFLRKVDHVVKARSQQQDVAFINGRDKRAVDKVVYLMCRVVAFVLEVTQPCVAALALEQRLAELGQRLADQLALSSEQLVEATSGGDWCEFHVSSARKAREPLVKASLTSPLPFSE